MNRLQSIALSLAFIAMNASPAFANPRFNFRGRYIELETNLDVWRSPRGRGRQGLIFSQPVNIKPQLLKEQLTCPAEEGGTQQVFIGPGDFPDMILDVTEPVKLDLFFHADLVTGRRAQLVFRKEGSDKAECFFERLYPIPSGRGSRVLNFSFSRVVQPGRYGVWFGLVNKPRRNLNNLAGNEVNATRAVAAMMGLRKINTISVFVDPPRR